MNRIFWFFKKVLNFNSSYDYRKWEIGQVEEDRIKFINPTTTYHFYYYPKEHETLGELQRFDALKSQISETIVRTENMIHKDVIIGLTAKTLEKIS